MGRSPVEKKVNDPLGPGTKMRGSRGEGRGGIVGQGTLVEQQAPETECSEAHGGLLQDLSATGQKLWCGRERGRMESGRGGSHKRTREETADAKAFTIVSHIDGLVPAIIGENQGNSEIAGAVWRGVNA